MSLRKYRRLLNRTALVGLTAAALGASPTMVPSADAAPAKAAAKPVKGKKSAKGALSFELPIQEFTLANGLRVYVVEDHSTPSFNMTLMYDVGSRSEVPGKTGFAHLFEHMMFEGSKNVPPMGHLTYVRRVGGNNNAGTSFDTTTYYNNLPSQHLDLGLWLESDRLRSLEITAENFENQRNAVKEEKAMRTDNVPYAAAISDWLSEAWAGSGYDHAPIGSLDDLNSVEVDYVQQFFDMYYSPDNAVLVFVGDVEFADLKGRVEKYFGDIPKGPERPAPRQVNIDVKKPLKKVVQDPLAQQALLLYGWHTVGQKHPDRPALDLLGNILLVGESARIPKILNDEKKLVAFSGGTHFALQDAGFVFMQALPLPTTKREDLEQVLADEVAKIQKKGISKKELQKAINRQLMNTVATLATNQGRASAIAQGALFHNDPKFVLTELERYAAVTPKDIKRVATQYLNDNLISLEIQPGAGTMPMPK